MDDEAFLHSALGADATQKLVNLYRKILKSPDAKAKTYGKVQSEPMADRELRTQTHQALRRIFSSKLESQTDADGAMWIAAAANQKSRGQYNREQNARGQQKGKLKWEDLGGEYLHFSIYKENKDTMEVMSFLARQLKAGSKTFDFAGTKDKRAVTVQRASAYRVFADRMQQVGRTLRNASLGDYEYKPHKLELGDLTGNEFVITLRECEIPGNEGMSMDEKIKAANQVVGDAVDSFTKRGYLNYYGLQRFGTFSTRTDTVGVKILQGDFKGACDAILYYSPEVLAAARSPDEPESSGDRVSREDRARADAIDMFRNGGQINASLDILPRKFSAESNLIRHLGKRKSHHEYFGGLMMIPRNLRLMYVHAYQSLVWNFAAGKRWELYGDKVVEGDLVMVDEHITAEPAAEEEVDEAGEVVVRPAAEDSAATTDSVFRRARALTAEEAASGKYTIYDVVLPQPGYDILYPANAMTDFYKTFMASEQGGGLDPFNMRRPQKDFSLSGSYRKFIVKPGPDCSYKVEAYARDEEQFVETDWQKIQGRKAEGTGDGEESKMDVAQGAGEVKDKIAVILKLQLGSSQYATMALRELMRGGVKTYKADFSGGR